MTCEADVESAKSSPRDPDVSGSRLVGDEMLDRLAPAYRRGSTLVLLFDYDGTLTPIVEHPAMAKLEPETRRVLERLAGLPRVCVGVLSGRALDDLKDMVGIGDLCYAGSAGLELEYQGLRTTHPGSSRTAALRTEVESRLQQLLAGYPGAWLEKKPLGITVHFRQLEPDEIAPLQSGIARMLEPFSNAVRVLPGPMAVEITPDLGWDKGTAVRAFMQMVGNNCAVLYAGDHANDADAFDVVASLEGITLGVGPASPPSAQYRLKDPGELLQFLSRLLKTLETTQTNA